MAAAKGVVCGAGGGSILRSLPLILLPGREGAPRHLRAPSASRAVDFGKQDGVHGQYSGEANRYSLFPSLQLGPEQSSDLCVGRLRWLFVQLGVELLELLHFDFEGRNDFSFTAFPVVHSRFSGLVATFPSSRRPTQQGLAAGISFPTLSFNEDSRLVFIHIVQVSQDGLVFTFRSDVFLKPTFAL